MNWIGYLIQANLYLVFFYTFYWFILKKETFFNLSRAYLLASALSAALIPLIKLDWLYEFFITSPVKQNFANATFVMMGGYATPIQETWSLGDYLLLVYVGVIFIMTGRLVYKLTKVNHLLKQKDHSEAFSFFKNIRVDENLPDKESIRKHELTHATQLHSADVLFFEVLAIINWFNPIVYLYKKSIRHIHEFIADEAVLQTEIDKKQYALLLLSQRFGVSANSLTNNFFNPSILKQRLTMMNKTKSRRMAILKYGLSAPLFLLAMVLSSAKISESKTISKISEKVKSTKELREILLLTVVKNSLDPNDTDSIDSKKNNNLKQNIIAPVQNNTADKLIYTTPKMLSSSVDTTKTDKILTNVEVLPSFLGGIQAFSLFLSENLKYPKLAQYANIQGRVFCQFVVEKDGSLSDIKVVKGIGGGCDEEAVRVLHLSPKWNPGLQKGETVRVSYTIPILFYIKDENIQTEPNTLFSFPFIKPSDNNKLIVVDGTEDKGRDRLKELKTNDIESVNILEGKTGAMMYGNKGKNGVVEITTKKK